MINILEPFSTKSSPSVTAVVHMADGSEPAPVSVRPKLPAAYSPEQILGMYVCFCSSEPTAWITSQTMLLTETVTAVEAHALARVHTQVKRMTGHGTTVPTFEQTCIGPLVFHADGVVECYACHAPADFMHLSTVSCQPGRRLGHGDTCARCAP